MRLRHALLAALSLLPAIPTRAADPPLPALRSPVQTEDVAVYKARREALMKQMGEEVAVVFAFGQAERWTGERESISMVLANTQMRPLRNT